MGPWLPEPIISRLPAGSSLCGPAPWTVDPAERAAQHEQVSMALLVVLERLTPEQRVAFVLHDVFGVPFDEIASALATTPEAARQLATRGRRAAADGAPRRRADKAEQRQAVQAF